jgi:hypothetical protein
MNDMSLRQLMIGIAVVAVAGWLGGLVPARAATPKTTAGKGTVLEISAFGGKAWDGSDTTAAVLAALDDIRHLMHEVGKRLEPDTHGGTLEVVGDTKKLLQRFLRSSRAKCRHSYLKRLKRFGRVIDETFEKFGVWL